MKALRFTGKGGMELFEKEKPKAKGDKVVVKVTSSGICGTDIELLLPSEEPLETVPGHEVTGIVAEVDKAKKFKVGDRVMVNCHVTCGVCEHCKNGDQIFCPELKAIGFELDGGNAEYVLVPEGSLRLLPEDITEELGVMIGDALGTPYHAVKKAGVKPDESVGIFGVGPLGQMAVMVAKFFGGRVIAVDINDKRLETSRDFGAEYAINPARTDVVREILEITGGRGIDKAIQCSPSASALNSALNSLRFRGRLVQVGVCTKAEINPLKQLNDREIEMVGSRNFNSNELDEIIDFVRKNPRIKDAITHRFSLDEAELAFQTAKSGESIKILIKP